MQTQDIRSAIDSALISQELMAKAGIQASELLALAELRSAVSKLVVPSNRLAVPEFIAVNDEIVRDSSTGLYWHLKISEKALTDDGESAYIASLNDRKAGGFSDWAAPTIRQLTTLIDYDTSGPATFSPFKESTKTDYWYRTSSALSAAPDHRWFVDFSHGYVSYFLRSYYGFVRAVRVASPGQ